MSREKASKTEKGSEQNGKRDASQHPFLFIEHMLAVAAATEDKHQSENDDPGTVVVEEMAQTVVHTKSFLPRGRIAKSCSEGLPLHSTILCRVKICVSFVLTKQGSCDIIISF